MAAVPQGEHFLATAHRLHQSGDAAGAIQNYRRAAIQGFEAEASMGLGVLLFQQGNTNIAIEHLRKARDLAPRAADPWINLCNALRATEQFEEGAAAGKSAVRLAPFNSVAHSNYAACLRPIGKLGLAKHACIRALELDNANHDAWKNYGAVLLDSGDSAGAVAAFHRALELVPHDNEVWDNFLFAAQYSETITDLELCSIARTWGELWPFSTGLSVRPNEIKRIGFVSGDFRAHPVGRFMIGLLTGLNKFGIECFLIKNQAQDDAMTEELGTHCVEIVDVWHRETEQAAAEIRQLGIDLAVDLSGHSAHNRLDLFAYGIAPWQATYLGYSATTGLRNMDFFIGDSTTLRDGCENQFTERLIRLPHCFAVDSSDASWSPAPSEANGYVTFGSFNNLAKLTDSTVTLWSKVLCAVPNSRLILKYRALDDREVRETVLGRFEAHGVESNRIECIGWKPQNEVDSWFERVDIALDPTPYSGATTTHDNLLHGVPVVTLAGTRYVGNMSTSFLNAIEFSSLVCNSEDEFVAKCAELAQSNLSETRKQIASSLNSSPIRESDMFANDFMCAINQAVTK